MSAGIQYHPSRGNVQPKQKSLPNGRPLVSAGGFEYHPSCGDARPKQKAFRGEDFFPVSAGGFEPSTNGLKGHCSAVELRARF